MKEVSCKAFASLDVALREERLTADELLGGVPYSLGHLRDKHERIEWSVYCRITRNAAQKLAPADFEYLGGVFTSSAAFRAGMVVARLLFRPAKLIRMAQGFEKEGRGMFTCVDSEMESLGPDRVRVTLNIQDGYENCPQFFYMTAGALKAILSTIGSSESTLRADYFERGATFDMYVPPRESLLGRIRRLLARQLSTTAAAEELQEAHDVLLLRYSQLEQARETLDHQAKQLRVANRVGHAIQQHIELPAIVVAMARSLGDELEVDGVEVVVESDSEGAPIVERAGHGRRTGEPLLLRELKVRGKRIGTLRVWQQETLDGLEDTLELILPTLVLAIENALAYHAVTVYRDELEARVVERTRELTLARDDLARSLTELEQAQAARDRIFANINHEVRTPLSIVRLAIEEARMLVDMGGNEGAVNASLETIDRNVERLLSLVDGILLLVAKDEGKLKIETTPTDMAKFIADEVESWAPLARKHSITMDVRSEGRAVAAVDRGAFQRVIANLLSNALKFTPEAGAITVSVGTTDGSVRISVEDTGVGMAPDFVTRAFDRFEQGPRPVHAGHRGSGIGLSISRTIVEEHHGTIEIDSEVGVGTEFIITLPASEAEPATDRAAPRPRALEPDVAAAVPVEAELPAAAPGRYTILLAEDETDMRVALAHHLSTHFRVLTASDGEEALDLARRHHPDMLITDIQMPGMDGIELTQRFMELSETRLAPTLLLTANATIETRLQGFEQGAVDYIIKPFHMAELLARVRAQLKVRELALRLHETEKLASVGMLGAGLAHEVRNPVNAISQAVRLLRRNLPDDVASAPESAKMLELLEGSSRQLLQTCKSISELENSGTLTLVEVDLDELLDSAIVCLPTEERHHVVVRMVKPCRLRCSRRLVAQVLVNLFKNSMDAGAGRVDVGCAVHDDEVRIVVADDGPGIDPSDRERVFEAFFTTKAPGQGTGLGLAVSRRVAQRHGGSLELVESERGCRFELVLPRICPHQGFDPARNEEPR